MRHEMDQEQMSALGRILITSGSALTSVARTAVTRWTRVQSLSAAVAFHATRSDVIGRTASPYDVLGTARHFETYIKDGRVNGND